MLWIRYLQRESKFSFGILVSVVKRVCSKLQKDVGYRHIFGGERCAHLQLISMLYIRNPVLESGREQSPRVLIPLGTHQNAIATWRWIGVSRLIFIFKPLFLRFHKTPICFPTLYLLWQPDRIFQVFVDLLRTDAHLSFEASSWRTPATWAIAALKRASSSHKQM